MIYDFNCFDADEQLQAMEEYMGKEIDFEYLTQASIIENHYPLHNGDTLERIQENFKKYKFKLIIGMLTGNYDKYMEPLNLIKNYYGEKYAYQIIFHIHYMAWLIIPSFFSLFVMAKSAYEYYVH